MSHHRLRTLSPGPCRLKLMQALQAGLTRSSKTFPLWRMREEKEMKSAIVANEKRKGEEELPSDDDGLVELPSDDCDDGGRFALPRHCETQAVVECASTSGPKG